MEDYGDLFSTGDIGPFLFTINPLGDKSYFSDVRIPIHAAEGYVFKAPQRAGLGPFPASKATREKGCHGNKNGCAYPAWEASTPCHNLGCRLEGSTIARGLSW